MDEVRGSRSIASDSEALILVDEADREVGHLDKARCHQGRGVLHRAFSLLIFNDAGELPLGFLVLLARSWKELPSRFASLSRLSTRVRRWVGDLAFGGQGELIHWPG